MTVTIITPTGDLDSRTDPLLFTADELITSVSVEFTPESGTSSREAVYDGTDGADINGTFSYPYRDSTIESGLWTIRREGGWPAPAQLRIKPRSTSYTPPSPPLAALQPTLYAPVAQYALQGAPNTARLWLDRSGNNRHLTAGNATATPDLISGQTAVIPPLQAQAGRLKCVGQLALAITGAMTVTCRIKRSGVSGCISVQSGIFGAGSSVNTLCSLILGTGAAIAYQWERTTGNMDQVQSPLVPPLDAWTFYSFRRDAAGLPTFGLDAGYWTPASGSYPVPPGGSASFLTIGDNDEAGNGQFSGAIADYCVWDKRLTDAELTPLRVAAMGL